MSISKRRHYRVVKRQAEAEVAAEKTKKRYCVGIGIGLAVASLAIGFAAGLFVGLNKNNN